VGGIGSFLRIEASGIRLATGAMVMAPDQLQRFRAAVVDEASGAELDQIRQDLAAKSLHVGPGKVPPLKRTPNGYPKDHPREELLRWKGAVVVTEYEHGTWMHRPDVIDTIKEVWSAAAPLKDWIDTHVGDSTTPPSRRPRG
jgi:hypothetical protein